MSEIRRRKGQHDGKAGRHGNKATQLQTAPPPSEDAFPPVLTTLSMLFGLVVMVILGYAHFWYMSTLHENNMWFTNIKEVEREISFRTESGLYYSYFKQFVKAKSASQGLYELMNDNITEYPDTINILERMNIYQEVILGFFYRNLPTKLKPILFYIYSIFSLHGVLVAALFILAWSLSKTWVAGALAVAFYIFNKADTTRVDFVIPLRESFSLPFLWVQIASISLYFRPAVSPILQRMLVWSIIKCTFFFALFWQFNQFILLLQAFALFGVWVLDIVPPHKVRNVLLIQLGSMLMVCALQFGNTMILVSMAPSFILASLLLMAVKGEGHKPTSVVWGFLQTSFLSGLALVLMFIFSTAIRLALRVEADVHIFKFILNKFGIGDARDFDSKLYLCLGSFGFLTFDTYERLTQGLVLPPYLLCHLALLALLLRVVLLNWRNSAPNEESKSPKEAEPLSPHIGRERPELFFHAIQCVMFGVLAVSTLRMKYLWTPYMCVLAAVGIGDQGLWQRFCNNKVKTELFRHAALGLVSALLLYRALPPVMEELKNLREFWDPDTVELMEWIKKDTAPTASFTGSMQLLAGVKLCTERPITNHPHYEDKHLRQKTKELYQIYGRRTPEDVHKILTNHSSNYIILEDSICMAPPVGGCTIPALIDIDNGVMPSEGEAMPGLVRSTVPRFCDQIRHNMPSYSKFFKLVFANKTFRVYKVL